MPTNENIRSLELLRSQDDVHPRGWVSEVFTSKHVCRWWFEEIDSSLFAFLLGPGKFASVSCFRNSAFWGEMTAWKKDWPMLLDILRTASVLRLQLSFSRIRGSRPWPKQILKGIYTTEVATDMQIAKLQSYLLDLLALEDLQISCPQMKISRAWKIWEVKMMCTLEGEFRKCLPPNTCADGNLRKSTQVSLLFS